MRWAALALVLGLVLTGCTSEMPTVIRSSGTPTAQGTAEPTTEDQPTAPNPSLSAEKQAAGIADCPASGTEAAVAGGLPDATLACLGGGRSVRLAGLRGTPMIINVWAQWCPPCRAEAPALAAVASSRTVRILGVDHSDPRPDLAVAFAGEMTLTYPQLYDPDGVFRTDLQVTALPVTFFVRADGTIAYRNAGPFTSADQLRQLAQTHLGVTP